MELDDHAADRIAESSEGSLEEVPFASLLYALARAERSTILEITRPPLVKEIILEHGVPVQCSSNLVHETLSRFIQTIGRLDEKTANECFAESCAKGVRFGDVLIDRGIIGAEELRKILQQNLARKLLDGFSWRQGSYRLSAVPPAIDSTLKVNVAQLIVIGLTRFATQDQIDDAIGPMVGTPLALNPQALFPVSGIRLSAQQKKVVDALAVRPRRIDELTDEVDVQFEDLARLIYALTLIGAVLPAAKVAEMPPPKSSGPPQRSATVPKAETVRIDLPVSDERRDELMRMMLNYRRMDAFELLTVDPDEVSHTVHDRFLDFAERFAPWGFEGDLAVDARHVFLAGARAYGELTDPDRRKALLDRRQARQAPRATTTAAETFRIRTDLLDPEVQFRKGKALMESGKYGDAITQLGYASDLDPQNAAYRAELAYCRFLLNPTVGGPNAIQELKDALRIDPRGGLAYYYTGEVFRSMGRFDEAEVALERAIKPMAPDRRPIDALRRLQLERKGKKRR